MRRLFKRFIRDERGALLAEALAAVTAFTLLGTAVMTSMSATTVAADIMRTNATADTIASNQMTQVLSDPYVDPPHTFTTITPPPGYSVTAESVQYIPGDTFISKIVVAVSKDGETIATLESLRMKGE